MKPTDNDDVLCCPTCGGDVRLTDSGGLECPGCDRRGSFAEGVLSFDRPADGPDRAGARDGEHLTAAELTRLAECTETTTTRDAVSTVLTAHPNRDAVTAALFDLARDDWRILASAALSGRCLDLNAGFGRRALLLGELVDEVYAVDRNRAKLRILSAREDFDPRNPVVPVQASLDGLPFSPSSFETIVADLTTTPHGRVRSSLESVAPLLTPDGALVALVDGLASQLTVPQRLGIDRPEPNARPSLGRATPAGFRSLFSALGFDTVDVYAMVPTYRRSRYVFDVTHSQPPRAVVSDLCGGSGLPDRLARTGFGLATRLGVDRSWYPNYCVVARRGDRSPSIVPSTPSTEPVVISGRARAVVLEYDRDDGSIRTVTKVPNRRRHVPITAGETRLLNELQSASNAIVDTLPDGTAADSRLGPIRRETPVPASPLESSIDDDLEAFRHVLETGFDWLSEFQRTFGSESTSVSPADLEAELTVDPWSLTPPSFDEGIELFSTPVHGDFVPENVYTRDGQVDCVIDWEYGALEACPIVDAGLFPLHVGSSVFGSIEESAEKLFCQETPYAAVTEEVVGQYCETVGLAAETVRRLLPIGYVHRIRLDLERDAITCYTGKLEDRIDRVQRLWSLLDVGD